MESPSDVFHGAPFGCLRTASASILFGAPMLLLFFTVSIGLAYGVDSPLLLVYALTLVVGIAALVWSLSRRRLLTHAVIYALFATAVMMAGTMIGS